MPNQSLIAVRLLTRDFSPPFSALTWHESDRNLFLPPNAIERELTLTKAWSYHFSSAIVPLMWNAPERAESVSMWMQDLETQLAKLGDHGEPCARAEGRRWRPEGLVRCAHIYLCPAEYGTEADFESALRRMIDMSLPAGVRCEQQHTVTRNKSIFRFDMLLYKEKGNKKQKVVIIELKYVREKWFSKSGDGRFRLSDGDVLKSFERHLEDAKLKERVEAARSQYGGDALKCHGLFIVAMHGGKYKVGSHIPKVWDGRAATRPA